MHMTSLLFMGNSSRKSMLPDYKYFTFLFSYVPLVVIFCSLITVLQICLFRITDAPNNVNAFEEMLLSVLFKVLWPV